MMMQENKTKDLFVLKLVFEKLYIKEKGKLIIPKDPDGDDRYVRHDIAGLLGVLGKFDTKIHILREYKSWITIRDKLREAMLKDGDEKEITLTLDEASFLKNFLKEFPNKEGKQETLVEFEIKSLLGALEQFEEV